MRREGQKVAGAKPSGNDQNQTEHGNSRWAKLKSSYRWPARSGEPIGSALRPRPPLEDGKGPAPDFTSGIHGAILE